ncbi:hypothetical protein [Aureivirga sp. CE67]|uniref:hypothetical protein n=1 Tax=Aureivirga sp. CE67 TaxID=1788983 RepID=UPI0018CA1638|nr:hypothetical protein [Aureivirga sp. CE67]
MKIKDKVFCVNESVYSDHIEKYKEYEIVDLNKNNFRIKSKKEKLVWIPNCCFSQKKPMKYLSFTLDDQINNAKDSYVEVSLYFENGERRYTNFMTPSYLTNLLNSKNYFQSEKVVFINEITEENIENSILELDKNNELLEISIS